LSLEQLSALLYNDFEWPIEYSLTAKLSELVLFRVVAAAELARLQPIKKILGEVAREANFNSACGVI